MRSVLWATATGAKRLARTTSWLADATPKSFQAQESDQPRRVIIGGMVKTGADIVEWRKERGGMQQQQLARKLGCHVISLNRWENGYKELPHWLSLALDGLDARNGKLPEPKKPKASAKKK